MNFENKEKYTAGNDVLSCAPGRTKRKRSLQLRDGRARTVDSKDFSGNWGIFSISVFVIMSRKKAKSFRSTKQGAKK